ncbi:MAG TPA: nuclear transport factor 2 family protein, partial [Acidimicrobiales bacterium]|nr:nuclear transport factor 2 family protein [Acidimicrobiales bacterium]
GGGPGGSWFRYGGDFQWSWQRDFFDVGNATAVYMEMIRDQNLSPGMTRRMERAMSGERLPGHYRLGEAPVGLWE